MVAGVLEIFHRARLEPASGWFEFFNILAGQVALAVDNARMFEGLENANIELALAYDATIEGWSHALDLRDRETEGHTQRVTELTLALARRVGLPEQQIPHIRRGALLHDIGKMGVPDEILRKPGALTEEEWAIMREHPRLAYDLLSPIAYLRPALDIPYCHHEKWDGSGYPRGLKGNEIPMVARLFAVVDVYDALTSARPYRPAWSPDQALAYIREQSGRHFDPRVVETFFHLVLETELLVPPANPK
jgi:putative nucleotidyltransferase with HDIG domain